MTTVRVTFPWPAVCRRTVYDEKNDREVVLTKQDLQLIRNLKAGKSPGGPGYDPYPVRIHRGRSPFSMRS